MKYLLYLICILVINPHNAWGGKNPIPQFTGFRMETLINVNYYGTSEGITDWSFNGRFGTIQKLYDSPYNGRGHVWVDYFESNHTNCVYPSRDEQHRCLPKRADIRGLLRQTKKHPHTITFEGEIVVQLGIYNQNTKKQYGHSQLYCIAQGEFEFVIDQARRGFYRLFDFDTPCYFPDGSAVSLGYVDLMTR